MLTDESSGKNFIASDFNRVGKSYRSPWSNQYIPIFDEVDPLYFPPESLRKLEQSFNELLQTFCALYYDGGVGSAYFSDSQSDSAIYGVVLIMKEFNDPSGGESHTWESVHSFQVFTRLNETEPVTVKCAMSSSVLTVFDYAKANACNLNGSVQKSTSRTWTIPFQTFSVDFDESLVRAIGEMLEENENLIRGVIDKVAIPRCVELALASIGAPDEEDGNSSLASSDEEDIQRPTRISLGAMNPLHRLSGRPVPAFQADLMGAVAQRRKTQASREDD